MQNQIPASSRLAIIGAGPVGLEAASRAARDGLDFVLFEKGEIASHLVRWAHVRLFTPFSMNSSAASIELLRSNPQALDLPAGDDYLTADDYRRRYLLPLSNHPQLRPRIFCRTQAVTIGKQGLSKRDLIGQPERLEQPFRILLRQGSREFIHLADSVIDASGVYSQPQALGSGNVPAPGEARTRRLSPERLHYGLIDVSDAHRHRFAGKRTLLVGAGYSAATHLEDFCRLAEAQTGTRVHWVFRQRSGTPYYRFQNDPLPYRDQLSQLGNRLSAEPPSWLTCHAGSVVDAIESKPEGTIAAIRVRLATPGGEERIEVDQIIASVGFQPDNQLYRQLQVHECYATSGPIKLAVSLLGGSGDCLGQAAQGLELLKNPEPNFFILGNKSYGTNTTFLLAQGFAQVDAVLNALGAQPRPGVLNGQL